MVDETEEEKKLSMLAFLFNSTGFDPETKLLFTTFFSAPESPAIA